MKGVRGLEPVNIPVQMICVVDTTGKISPLRFRYRTADSSIESALVENVISRDEQNCVGIREKRYICVARMGEAMRTLEIRYHVESQKWRIVQFLT